jgi:hypothetical protein
MILRAHLARRGASDSARLDSTRPDSAACGRARPTVDSRRPINKSQHGVARPAASSISLTEFLAPAGARPKRPHIRPSRNGAAADSRPGARNKRPGVRQSEFCIIHTRRGRFGCARPSRCLLWANRARGRRRPKLVLRVNGLLLSGGGSGALYSARRLTDRRSWPPLDGDQRRGPPPPPPRTDARAQTPPPSATGHENCNDCASGRGNH